MRQQSSRARVLQSGLVLSLGLALVFGLMGCTKELPYQTQYKETVFGKDQIDPDAEYLYVASYQDVSRSSSDLIPFFQGEEKIVKLRFTDKALQAVEMDKDERFVDNPSNNKPVFEIPVAHLDYRCAQDRAGECTNREEENTELAWNEKTKFKPDFSNVDIKEISILSIEMQEVSECYSLVGQRYLDHTLKKDSIDFRIERQYQINIKKKCSENIESLSDASISVVYHYSLRKLSTVASSDYKSIEYPEKDERTFGFFTNKENNLDVDNRKMEKNKRVLMNRWNPNRKEIVYLLSREFLKPENSSLRAATVEGVARVNKGLETSGVPFRIVIKDAAGEQAGEISNNMLVMVEDPSESGILGYGPTITNPRTGEILSGRVIMYAGVMKEFLIQAYEDLRSENSKSLKSTDEPKRVSLVAQSGPEEGEGSSGDDEATPVEPRPNQPAEGRETTKIFQKVLADSLTSMKAGRGAVLKRNLHSKRQTVQRSATLPRRNAFASGQTLEKIRSELKNYAGFSTAPTKIMDRLEAMSKHCLYPADLFDFTGFMSTSGIASGDLQPWDALGKKDKKQILDKLLALVWIPTLVHELGHNLGLRHNFAGSEDKENFYDRVELDQLNIKSSIPYSSVMDYPRSKINSLTTLGKYDIAALRFGYLRQVETKKGQLVIVDSTLQELLQPKRSSGENAVVLKSYQFCADENVGPNAGCKRHDEGTTFEEITDVLIRDFYQDQYKFRNFRNGRANFSLLRDKHYAAHVGQIFDGLRAMYEAMERISNRYSLPDDAKEWTDDADLVDLRRAADKAASFFVDVLREPDVVCLIGEAKDPSRLVGVELLANYKTSEIPLSCSEVELDPGFVVVGEAGKSFSSHKGPKSTNAYADQIDVRGIWIDKLLALEALVGRYTGTPSFDEYTENMLTMPGVAPAMADTIAGIINDFLVGDIIFKTPAGEKLVLNMNYSLYSSHLIEEPVDNALDEPLRKKFALNDKGETLFIEAMMRILARELPSTIHQAAGGRFLEPLQVYREIPANGKPLESYIFADVGSQRYLALKDNNLLAADIITNLNMVQILDKVDKKKLNVILATVKAGEKPPAHAKPEERAAAAVPVEFIEAYIRNLFLSESYYARMLSILPAAK